MEQQPFICFLCILEVVVQLSVSDLTQIEWVAREIYRKLGVVKIQNIHAPHTVSIYS